MLVRLWNEWSSRGKKYDRSAADGREEHRRNNGYAYDRHPVFTPSRPAGAGGWRSRSGPAGSVAAEGGGWPRPWRRCGRRPRSRPDPRPRWPIHHDGRRAQRCQHGGPSNLSVRGKGHQWRAEPNRQARPMTVDITRRYRLARWMKRVTATPAGRGHDASHRSDPGLCCSSC
jgi:hypothetical protein